MIVRNAWAAFLLVVRAVFFTYLEGYWPRSLDCALVMGPFHVCTRALP